MRSRFSAATNGADPEASQQSKLARVLDDYLAAIEAGEAVDPEALAAANPDIAERLRACISVLRVASRVEGRAEADAAIEPAVDARLGDFRILRMVGRGGMGIVFEAEEVSLRRRVALKVLPFAAALDPQQLRRFQIEAQAAAQLHHTNIVPIFSVGCERGVHYYAMQFIDGQTLAALIRDLRRLAGLGEATAAEPTAAGVSLAEEIVSGRLDPAPAPRADGETPAEARAAGDPSPRPTGETVPEGRVRGRPSRNDRTYTPAYFRTVAHLGLQAAEALDYAHRLGIIHRDIKPANLLVDFRGNLWVTDFGLARMQADSGLTMTGDVIGTLRYMSPEQASARRGIVDHRADVYSLGATLYELLTLHSPHDGRDRAELLHQIAFGEPGAPRGLNRSIPRDLETVVLKALAKEPAARYAMAQELADDLRRFLEGRTVQARRPRLWTRIAQWARRHKPLTASLFVIVALMVASGAIVAMLARSNRQLDNATRSLDRLGRQERYVKDIRQAFHLVGRNELAAAARLLDRHRPMTGEEDLRTFPWHYLWRLCHFRPRTFEDRAGEVFHIDFSPDGRTLASCGQDGAVRLRDAATGQVARVLLGHDGDANCVAFSPNGQLLATGDDGGSVRLWDLASRRPPYILGKHTDWVIGVLFTPDGRWLMSHSRSGTFRVWDTSTRQERDVGAFGSPIQGIGITADGRTLGTGAKGNPARLWDFATARVRLTLPADSDLRAGAISHDGTVAVTAHMDRTVRVYDAGSGRLKATLLDPGGQIECVRFSPDDRTIATCGGDGTIRIWDLASGRHHKLYRGHVGMVWWVAFSPDGRNLASCGRDSRVNLWDLAAGQDRIPVSIPGRTVESMAFSPDSRRITVLSSDGPEGTIVGLDPTRGDLAGRRRFRSEKDIFRGILSPGAKRLVTGTLGTLVTLWDLERDPIRSRASVPSIVDWDGDARPLDFGAITCSQDGRFFAISKPAAGGLLWDTETGIIRRVRRSDLQMIQFPSPDHPIFILTEGRLAHGDLSLAEGGPSKPTGHRWIICAAPSVNGRIMATGGIEGAIKLWDTTTLEAVATMVGHDGEVSGLAWSPDGRVLASAGEDRSVRLWDVATGQELGVLENASARGMKLMFSPDGTILAGYGSDPVPQVVLWPAPRDERPSR